MKMCTQGWKPHVFLQWKQNKTLTNASVFKLGKS